MTQPSNDTIHPRPVTEIDAKRWLDVDLPGLEIGVAEYAEGPTGCTVFGFERTASLQTDVRGGSPGVVGENFPVIDAICFAGGSIYGLEASTGAAAELFAQKAYATTWNEIQLVAGAIVDRTGDVVRGNRDPKTGTRRRAEDIVATQGAYDPPTARARAVTGNTNLTLLVTDQKLDSLQLRSIARQTHASMARTIQPFHTRWDGDVLFAVSTQRVENPALDEVSLGIVASEIAWDAALSCFDP